MTTKLIYLDTISIPDSPHVRYTINDEVVDQYAQCYVEKKDMPPIVVFWNPDKKIHLLADGRHRCEACYRIKRKAVMAVVHEGDYVECLKYALLSNSTHGLQRNNKDKRQCVILTLKQWPELSNNHAAVMCGVDDKTVTNIRNELEAEKVIPKTTKRIGKDGKSHDIKQEEKEVPRVTAAKIAVDPFGRPIPHGIVKFWERSEEPKELILQLSNLASHFKRFNEEKDPMYGELNFTGIMADMAKVIDSLTTAIPYCVCTQCQGHPETQPKGECRMCYGRGLISKFRFDTCVTKEVKAIMGGKKK